MNGGKTGSSTQTELVDIEWVPGGLNVTVRHVRRLVSENRRQVGAPPALRSVRDRNRDRRVTLATGQLSGGSAMHVDSGPRVHGGLLTI